MLKKLNKFVQQKIARNYNKIANKDEHSYSDAAFMTLLDFVYALFVFVFTIFGIVSFSLFTKYEVVPWIRSLL